MTKNTNEKAPTDAQGRHATKGDRPFQDGQPPGDRDVFLAVARMSPVPMCLSDPNRPDNPLVFVNRAFEDLTGYPEEEALGRNCRFLQGPATDLAVTAEVGRSLAAKVDVSVEVYNYRKDGKGFWNALHLSPVLSDAGDLLYFFGSLLDVTKRRQAETILKQSQHPYAPDGTVADIAHELDSLITGVTGSLEQARANPSSKRQAQQLAHAVLGAEQAGQLTRQLLSARQQPGDEGRPGRPAAVPPPGRPWPGTALGDGGAALVLRPVRVDTQGEDEEGCLVFGHDRLVAVLVRLSGQHGALAGRWHLEHGFGALDGPEHPSFASLDAARGWIGRQLGRTDGDKA